MKHYCEAIDVCLKAFKRAKYTDLMGEEVLALSSALNMLLRMKKELEGVDIKVQDEVKPSPKLPTTPEIIVAKPKRGRPRNEPN